MKECDVRKRAFAMPLTSSAHPPGPYCFRQREYLVIADLTFGLGKVVHDYLKQPISRR